jgi:predicted transcriptional regulator
MACIGSQGELTESAHKMLSSLARPSTAEDVAERTSLPLFRVRAGLREMMEAKLVEMEQSLYRLTESGRSAGQS